MDNTTPNKTDGLLYWVKDGKIKNFLDLNNLNKYHVKSDSSEYPRFPKLIIIHENNDLNDVRLVLTYEGVNLWEALSSMIEDANEYDRSVGGGKKIRKNRKSKKNRKTNKRRKFSKKV